MKVLFKSTLILTFTFSGFALFAQDVSMDMTPESQSVISALSENVTAEASAEGAKSLITKAERQAIGRLKNLFKIDDGIYRSEQPDQNDFSSLEKIGLAEVLNVRRFWSDNRKAGHTKLKLHHISMKAGDVKEREVIKALKLINDRKGPILIHCWHGSDRTGMLIAMYRVIFQNWTKDDAIHEMTNGGFGFHTVYSNLIDFVKDADVNKLREKIVGKKDTEKMKESVVLASEL